MKETTREFIERYRGLIGTLYIIVGVAIAALILPRAYARAALGVLVLAFAVFLVWVLTPLPRRTSSTQAPGPTIREHLKRTRAYLQRIVIPVAAAWWLGVAIYGTGLSNLQQQALGVGGGVILLLLGGLCVRNQLRCPGCGTDFSRERSAQVGRLSFDTRGPEDLWDSCPRCGLSFDAPWAIAPR
jgi:hypothetical protein